MPHLNRLLMQQEPLNAVKRAAEVLTVLTGLSGLITTFLSSREKSPFGWWAGVGLLAAGFIGNYAARRWKTHRRPQVAVKPLPEGGRAYLRGLLPFNEGDSLLGGDRDVQRLAAIVSDSAFRFGYVSGEAGVGKTSLLRAGLLPSIKALGFQVLYLERTGTDPARAISRALEALLGSDQLQFGESEPGQRNLAQTLAAFQRRHPGSRLLIVCDQFEEFFITHPASARRPYLEEVSSVLVGDSEACRLLVGIRKEFVDDLQDLAPFLSNPTNEKHSHRLRNWDTDEALAVLAEATHHDGLRFSKALQTEVVQDLGHRGEVRPVEFQLVATHLDDRRIYELAAYRSAGRAVGVLSSYVAATIEPSGVETPALERQVARHLLRSLCADSQQSARRPVGLTLEQLTFQVRASLRRAGEDGLIQEPAAFVAALEKALERCQQDYLIIHETEDTFNLSHDYIVPAIREATAGIETVEEQANRLLDQYVDQDRKATGVTVPVRHLHFISRYASPVRRSALESQLLMQRSWRAVHLGTAMWAAGFLVVFLAIFPPRQSLEVVGHIKFDGYRMNRNRQFVIVNRGKDLWVWDLARNWDQSRRINFHAKVSYYFLGALGRYLGAVTESGKIYVWPSRGEPDLKSPAFVLRGSHSHVVFPELRFGISPDETWVYAVSEADQLYVWKPEETVASSSLPSVRVGFGSTQFSLKSKFLYAPGHTSAMSASHTTNREGFTLLKTGGYTGNITFLPAPKFAQRMISPDETWLAAINRGSISIYDLRKYPKLNHFELRLPSPETAPADFRFSADSSYIVGVSSNGQYWSVKLSDDLTGRLRALFQGPSDYSSYLPELLVGPSRWCIGLHRTRISTSTNRGAFIWKLDQTPGTKAEPLFPSDMLEGKPIAKFSPLGDYIAASPGNGQVYVWKPGAKPGRLFGSHSSDEVNFIWSADSRFLFTFADRDLMIGTTERGREQEIRSFEKVSDLAVTADHKQLVVLGARDAKLVELRLRIWGVHVWTFPWPTLAPRAED